MAESPENRFSAICYEKIENFLQINSGQQKLLLLFSLLKFRFAGQFYSKLAE